MFTLTPRIPRHAIDLEEEDFTTPRVCLAPSIKNAMSALCLDIDDKPMFVYATVGPVQIVKPQGGEIPLNICELSKDQRGVALKGRVPDANRTGEVWSLKPVTVECVKVISETYGGSQPTEAYDHMLLDDPAWEDESMLVPNKYKLAMKRWAKSMGLYGKASSSVRSRHT